MAFSKKTSGKTVLVRVFETAEPKPIKAAVTIIEESRKPRQVLVKAGKDSTWPELKPKRTKKPR